MIGNGGDNSFCAACFEVRKNEDDGDFFLMVCQGFAIRIKKTNANLLHPK